MSCEETHGEHWPCALGDAPRGHRRRFRLRKRQPRVIQKCLTGGGKLNPSRAAPQKLRANLALQIADLPAERGLRGVQPSLGSKIEATLFGDRNEITKVPELHFRFYASQAYP